MSTPQHFPGTLEVEKVAEDRYWCNHHKGLLKPPNLIWVGDGKAEPQAGCLRCLQDELGKDNVKEAKFAEPAPISLEAFMSTATSRICPLCNLPTGTLTEYLGARICPRCFMEMQQGVIHITRYEECARCTANVDATSLRMYAGVKVCEECMDDLDARAGDEQSEESVARPACQWKECELASVQMCELCDTPLLLEHVHWIEGGTPACGDCVLLMSGAIPDETLDEEDESSGCVTMDKNGCIIVPPGLVN